MFMMQKHAVKHTVTFWRDWNDSDHFVLMKVSLSHRQGGRLSNGCSPVAFTNDTRTVSDRRTEAVPFFIGDVRHVLADGKVVSWAAASFTCVYNVPFSPSLLLLLVRGWSNSSNSDADIDVFMWSCSPVLQVYYYAASQITCTTYPTGLEVLHFPNNQIGERFLLILYFD